MYVYHTHSCVHRRQKRVLSLLKLLFQMVVNHKVSANNKSQFLYKSSKCSQSLRHLPNPKYRHFKL